MTESITWRIWLPNGWKTDLRRCVIFFVALVRAVTWSLRWLLAASLMAPVGLWVVYRDDASAIQAAKIVAGGYFALIIVLPALVAFLNLVFVLALPMTYRIDQAGIARLNDPGRPMLYPWSQISDLCVRYSDGLVPYIECQTKLRRIRIAIPRDVTIQSVLGTIEHWYGRPVVAVHDSREIREQIDPAGDGRDRN